MLNLKQPAASPLALGLAVLIAMMSTMSSGCGPSGADLPAPPALRNDPPLPPGTADISNRSFTRPLSVADAEQILMLTEIFQYGTSTWQVRAYNTVYEQPDAIARFRVVAERARWAGQLYAFSALTILQPDGSTHLGRRLAAIEAQTLVYDGDWGGERRVADLVNVIQERKLGEELRSLREVSVQIAVLGQPLFASSAGHDLISDSPVTIHVPAAAVQQEVSGTFAGDSLIVAFAGSTAAGGVRAGSLVIEDTPGELVRGMPGWQDGCVARVRRVSDTPGRFRVRYTLTTNAAEACSPLEPQ